MIAKLNFNVVCNMFARQKQYVQQSQKMRDFGGSQERCS